MWNISTPFALTPTPFFPGGAPCPRMIHDPRAFGLSSRPVQGLTAHQPHGPPAFGTGLLLLIRPLRWPYPAPSNRLYANPRAATKPTLIPTDLIGYRRYKDLRHIHHPGLSLSLLQYTKYTIKVHYSTIGILVHWWETGVKRWVVGGANGGG